MARSGQPEVSDVTASARKQFLRFAAIGVIGAALYIGTAAGLVNWANASPVLANAVAFCLNTAFSFSMNTWLNFSVPFTMRNWLRFCGVSLLGLALTATVAAVAEGLGLHYGYGIAMVAVSVPPLTFLLHRNWTYR
jgi:putative flippase GtrA